MKVIECYSIEVWDGGDRHNHKFYLASKEEAEKYKENNTYDNIVRREFIIFDTLDEAIDNDLRVVRERVISRLSPIERKAMGV